MVRVEDYRFDLLNQNGMKLGTLDGIAPGGRLTGNLNARIRWSGTLTYTGLIPNEHWYRYRIRPVLTVNSVSIPLGTYVVRAGQTQYLPEGKTVELDLYDATLLPAQDAISDTISLPAKTRIGQTVIRLLADTGARGTVIGPDETTIATPMVWQAGTSMLRVINDLLAAGGYRALWTDFTGAYRIEKYQPPSARPVTYRFAPGVEAIHTNNQVVKQDAKVPNKIVCISQETATTPAMRAIAVNEDPLSPYSFQNQGVWVAAVHTGIETGSQQALDQIAARYLANAQTSTTITRHLAATPIELGSIVADENGALEVVENINLDLTPGELMEITSRKTK